MTSLQILTIPFRLLSIYFIPEPHAATAANILTDRLSKRHQPILLGKWSLEHRLLRETAPPPAPSSGSGTTSPAAPQQQQQQQQQQKQQQQQQSQQSQQQVRFMQWLDLSYHPTKLFVYTPSPRVMATLDREFEILVRVKMSGLWTLIKTMRAEGLVYEVEDFRVRVANVVQGGGGEAVKGVLVEVEYVPCAHLEGDRKSVV